MNIVSYARGLFIELEGEVRKANEEGADAVRAEIRRVLPDARKGATAEQGALDKGDPAKADYDKLIADLDDFGKNDKPGAKRNTAAAAAPEKA